MGKQIQHNGIFTECLSYTDLLREFVLLDFHVYLVSDFVFFRDCVCVYMYVWQDRVDSNREIDRVI